MKSLATILLLIPVLALAQPYGNEWINFNQEYYRIRVPDYGIYRIAYADLDQTGFPVASVDPQKFQMFRRGEEIAILVQGESDGSFDPGDYIEFYGEKNDGALDSALYIDPSYQPHKYISLYADSASYFLTVNSLGQNGKRMNTDPGFSGTPDNYVYNSAIKVFSNAYVGGLMVGSDTRLTRFDIGEGFTGSRVRESLGPVSSTQIFSSIVLPELSAPAPQLEFLVVGRTEAIHKFETFVGPDVGNLRSVGQYSFSGYSTKLVNTPLNWTDISPTGELVVRITIIDDGSPLSIISMSYARLDYARKTDINNENFVRFVTEPKISGGAELLFVNSPAQAEVLDITDPRNPLLMMDTDANPATLNLGLADATGAHELAIGVPLGSFSIEKAQIRKPDVTQPNYVIISHRSLMAPAGGYADPVKAFAEYRTSVAGGSYDTLVVDIDLLYNLYSYGQPTPLAVYHFVEEWYDKGNPEYLFIIGKGLDVSYKYHKIYPYPKNYHDLVPTAGSPGSDIVYTTGLLPNPEQPAFPAGRLSVMNAIDVANYLNKIVEMEATPYNALWRKNVLHLSGGKDVIEQNIFKAYLDEFGEILKGHYLGGEITTVSKATTATVEFINVSEEVNKGLNLITFFGHSAPDVIDVDIGFVTIPENNYANKGKYPYILMNGCSSGNVFVDRKVFSEDWVAAADLGATGVISHSSYGYPSLLRIWSNTFYSLAYADSTSLDKTAGQIHTMVSDTLMSLFPSSNYALITQVQQMAIQGDPAVKLFGARIPDFEVNQGNVTISAPNEGEITAALDSLQMKIYIRNFGAYTYDSLKILVRRTLPVGGTGIDYDTLVFAPPRYQDTLQFLLNNKFPDNAGLNTFEIYLDPANEVPELDELNNYASVTWFIPEPGTINITPVNFGIVANTTLDLNSFGAGAEIQNFNFELDSAWFFDSPIHQSTIQSATNLATWQAVGLPASDSTAYYWRSKFVEPDSIRTNEWNTSTFTRIAGSAPGWAQVAFRQKIMNDLDRLVADTVNAKIEFESNELAVEVIAHGANNPNFTYKDTELYIDDLAFIVPPAYSLCYNNKLNIVAFNKDNAAPYAPIPGTQVDNWTCGRSPQVINVYPNSGGYTIDDFLDVIPAGDRVVLFTTGNFNFNSLSMATLAKLEDLGANAAVMTGKLVGEPYILFGYKGAGSGNGTAEIVADPSSGVPADEQTISHAGMITGTYGNGLLTSPDIGPALAWSTFKFNVKTAGATDSYGIDIIGKTLDGTETTLLNNLQNGPVDLSGIDANVYALLKLQLNLQDDIEQTAPQLDAWSVTYSLPPEGYLTYVGSSEGSGAAITVPEGKEVTSQFRFINISDKDFKDSLRFEYTILNKDNGQVRSESMTKRPLAAGDTLEIDITIKTEGLAGINNLQLTVNPMDYPEVTYANNSMNMVDYLNVIEDRSNPILDVTFDGEYIFDGDIVSANPAIRIVIRDENEYLLKTDTTGMNIFLTRPCEGCTSERIALSSPEITWTPETSTESFTIDFQPKDLEDGTYKLAVQAEDANGNVSGTEPYSIHFEVINKSTVTNFYPYPNPFSDQVRFVFTLTGNEVPDEILIRIFTVSGRVVREITQDELGSLKIGNNISDFAWDGRDEYGDQLANGVYLYKVFIRTGGRDVELRPSSGDRGFTKGYGKMYLLK